MMQFNIVRTPGAAFVPTTITVTVDTSADLALVTNLFGGVPAGTGTVIDDLAVALRATCEEAGISQSARKAVVGFNWGRKLREALAAINED